MTDTKSIFNTADNAAKKRKVDQGTLDNSLATKVNVTDTTVTPVANQVPKYSGAAALTVGKLTSALNTLDDGSGNVTIAGTLNAGATNFSSLSTSGALSAGNTTVTGTLGVSGAATVGSLTTAGTLTAGSTNFSSLSTSGTLSAGNTTVTGTLGVSGAATVGSLTTTGAASAGSTTVTGLTVSGVTTGKALVTTTGSAVIGINYSSTGSNSSIVQTSGSGAITAGTAGFSTASTTPLTATGLASVPTATTVWIRPISGSGNSTSGEVIGNAFDNDPSTRWNGTTASGKAQGTFTFDQQYTSISTMQITSALDAAHQVTSVTFYTDNTFTTTVGATITVPTTGGVTIPVGTGGLIGYTVVVTIPYALSCDAGKNLYFRVVTTNSSFQAWINDIRFVGIVPTAVPYAPALSIDTSGRLQPAQITSIGAPLSLLQTDATGGITAGSGGFTTSGAVTATGTVTVGTGGYLSTVKTWTNGGNYIVYTAGGGTSVSATVTGGDAGGLISVTAGTGSTSNGAIIFLSLGGAKANGCAVTISPANFAAAGVSAWVDQSTTGFFIRTASSTLTNLQQYLWTFTCIGY